MKSQQLIFERPGIRETQSSDLYLSEVGKSVGVLIPSYRDMTAGDLIRLSLEFPYPDDSEHFEHVITNENVGKTITIEVLKQVFQDHLDKSVKVLYEVKRGTVSLGVSAIRGLKINP
ncbi:MULTISPECIES: hypothetical protein [unclassified Pseudomonas]|jgi:hypothetical protein|uniref:hypothetical protein n=1 Tax=unclassified Pseudomonas TaxID=196821 RepID=UPI001C490757|nr:MULTISPECIES: hypothetical protein [unclassified Pseudomonas]MBV7514156.1 hypothetical protein [Pseudomonas sp. PDM25]